MKLSIGHSRKDTHWKVKNYSWEQLTAQLSKTTRTSETVAEYFAMSKDERSEKKDIGGFVGGTVKGGRRTRDSVTSRSLITLDADYADEDSWDNAVMMSSYAMCCYSTHSHRPASPRLRYIIPLSREVAPEEYEPIARKVASDLGIEQFDITTYELNRLMYWPSTPKDGEFIFEQVEGEPLDPDEVLSSYSDWHDTSSWPISSKETKVLVKTGKAQGDPAEKRGIVGLFCRAYSIHDAIDKFLSEEYKPCLVPDRYTYTGGSTAAGLVIYDDKFAYSHHSTDPASGQLCNAFDLVRLHKFGELDYTLDEDVSITKRPSYKAMQEFATQDDEVKKLLVAENKAEVEEAFSEEMTDDLDWTKQLEVEKNGTVKATIPNIKLILDNDPMFAGCLAKNEFTGRLCCIKSLPWHKCEDPKNGDPWIDAYDSAVRERLEAVYGISSAPKIDDAISLVMMKHSFHPVRNYLRSLSWDGTPRAETLFIDYLGAENDHYTRTVTRKWLTAAVARIMRPGVKFDNMIVLVGRQGIGKSYLGKLLGQEWFSDTLITVQGKEAMESLLGVWIMEMGELAAMKKAEVESVKMFISKQEDRFRAAYARNTEARMRQCVFYGTTNDEEFLRDTTGNRRFWPIGCEPKLASSSVFSLTKYDIDQIWAEVVTWYDNGEDLYLDSETAILASETQARYTIDDPRAGEIQEYLDMPIPENWEDLSREDRRNYIQGFLVVDGPTVPRNRVCAVEVAYELYGKKPEQSWQMREFNNILRQMPGWVSVGRKRSKIYGLQRCFERSEDDNS